jgi:LacI family transcriptional regulator
VFFDRIPNIPNIHQVSCNMESGTLKAMNFLLKNGHRIIGMINGPEKLFASQQRMEGYIKAMRSHPLKFDPDLVVSSDLTKEGTENAMARLISLRRKITAVIAFNDYVALDAIQFARERNIKINEDITFVSYSNLPMSNHTAFPPVASLEQFPYQQGQKATEVLIELLNKKESTSQSTSYKKITLESQLAFNQNRAATA